MINIDLTLLFQLANFLVAMVVLNILLIRPVRGIVRQRRDLAGGLLRDTERFAGQAAEKLGRYEAALAAAREQGARDREARKAVAAEREHGLLAAAQSEAQDFLRRSREETRKAVDAASRDLLARVPEFAAQAAARLLDLEKKGGGPV